MHYAEFRRHLGKAGMTINDFAAYLGVRPASVSNYSKPGTVPRTYAIIAILLGEAADRGISAAVLLANFGVLPQAVPSGSNVEQLDMFRAARAPSEKGLMNLARMSAKVSDSHGGTGSAKAARRP